MFNNYGCNNHDVVILNLTHDPASLAASDAANEGKEYPVLADGADGGYDHYKYSGAPAAVFIGPDRTMIDDDVYPVSESAMIVLFNNHNCNEFSCTSINADFSVDIASINAGESVNFTDQSTSDNGSITSWSWTFQGGTPHEFSGQNPPAISYSNNGSYEVTLEVSNGTDNHTRTKTNYIMVGEPCAAEGTNSSGNEYISKVSFGTINNSSQATAYSNFTSQSLSINTGTSEILTVTSTNGYDTDKLIAWIDWNADNDFDDSGEKVFSSSNGDGPYTKTINVPSNASVGTVRMRLRLFDTGSSGANATPCGIADYGEVEDYSLHISYPTDVTNLSDKIFNLYPSPNNGVFTINTTSSYNKVMITDVSGKMVYNKEIDNSVISIKLTNITKGIYFVRVSNENGVGVQKIIIE